MPTVRELALELGIPEETLTAKADVVSKYDTYFAASASADARVAEAQKKFQDAEALQRVIDENIRQFGLTEANVTQLQASNAAMKAALDEVKKAGFTGINIPDFPSNTPPAVDPNKAFQDKVTSGFAQIGQAMRVQNQYFQVFGKALPDDPVVLADEASARRMSITDYAEQKYGLKAEQQRQQVEATKAREAEIAAAAVKKYQEEHPATTGNPHLNPGVPSNFPARPKPRDGNTVREFSTLPTREKIANAMQRAIKAAPANSQ